MPMPKAVSWYRTYALCYGILNLVVALVGATGLGLVVAGQVNGSEEGNFLLWGSSLGGWGCCFGILFTLLPFVLPRQGWAWAVHLIAIFLTMTSCCCIPLAIPLLIQWFKPETKLYYNMKP